MAIEIVDFRKYEKNTLKGFVTVRLTNIGLELRDLTLHSKGGKRWLNLPAKPYEKDDGSTGYSYIVLFPDENRYRQFQKATLEAFDKHLRVEAPTEQGNEPIPF